MIQTNLEIALSAHRAGDLARAAEGYRTWLAANPEDAAALHLLGVLMHQQGNSAAGLALIDRAIALAPRLAPLHANRAAALAALSQDEPALAAIAQATALDASLEDALADTRARLELRTGRFAAAAETYRRLTRIAPGQAAAWSGLALALHAGGDAHAALPAYRQALVCDPADTAARNGLGAALLDTGQAPEALAVLERAAAAAPAWGPLLANLGNARRATGDIAGAADALRQARAADPANPTTLANLCAVLSELGQLGAAIEAGRAATAIESGHEAANVNLAAALFDAGSVADAIALWNTTGTPAAAANALYAGNFLPGSDAAGLEARAREVAARIFPPVATRPAPRARGAGEPLRIGFVSPDLRSHSVAWFLLPVLEHIDRRNFELHAFAEMADEDAVTQMLRPRFARWTNSSGLDDAALAALVRAAGIDVLIDLAGHTAGNRLAMFAHRPARVQMAWLGYPGPTGLAAIDWRLSDPAIDPGDRPGPERPLHLAHGCHAYAPPPQSPPVDMRTAGTALTFGSFNNWPKHSAPCIAAWARILEALPGARLVLKNKAMGDAGVAAAARGLFASHGIDPARIECWGRVPEPRGHLALYSAIDIALDPFPYNGATTTCEALAMGVPVVALRGTTPAGRVAAAFLGHIGRPEWAADTVDTYIGTAIALAHDASARRHARETLRARLLASPLGDGKGLARRLESAWRQAFSAG